MKHLSYVPQRASRNESPRFVSGLVVLALLLAAALSVGGTRLFAFAGNEAVFGGSGGDSIGSLPLSAPGGSHSHGPLDPSSGPAIVGPVRPSVVLTGREEDLIAVLLDATPHSADANFDVFALPDGRLRLEFYGQLTLMLDQARLMATPVTAQIRVGSTFQGGIATLAVAGEVRGAQALPLGYLPLPLQQLSSSGVLPLGLIWNAQSQGGLHRVLDIQQSGSVIHLRQLD